MSHTLGLYISSHQASSLDSTHLASSAHRLQKIVHRNDGTETVCTERDGWCLPKTTDHLRDTMSLMILQTIRSERPGESHLCREASDLFKTGLTKADKKLQRT